MRYQFRVWNVMSKKMMGWGEIFDLPAWEIFPGTPEQRPFNVMQYTGLKDKNGKEIYEGDIVKYLDGNEWSTESGYDCEEFNNHGAIFFDEECGRYDVTNKQGIGYDDLFDCGVDFEIIGNIYENPELVKN